MISSNNKKKEAMKTAALQYKLKKHILTYISSLNKMKQTQKKNDARVKSMAINLIYKGQKSIHHTHFAFKIAINLFPCTDYNHKSCNFQRLF